MITVPSLDYNDVHLIRYLAITHIALYYEKKDVTLK